MMKRMETYKSFHQTGSLCIYHFGEKIVNFLDKVKNNDLDKIKIMVLTLIFHYTIIHFIEILGFGCRGMHPGKKGIWEYRCVHPLQVKPKLPDLTRFERINR